LRGRVRDDVLRVLFKQREDEREWKKSTGVTVREDEQRGGNVIVVKIVLAVDRTKRETVPAGGCDDARVGRVGRRGETDVRE